MDTRTRLVNTLNFKPVDRLPVLEWAGWWNLTVDRWHTEGLPAHLNDAFEIREYFGMDAHRQCRIVLKKANCPPSPGVGKGIIGSMDDYRRVKEYLYPDEPFDGKMIAGWEEQHKKGLLSVWVSFDSFFFFPRNLLGVEEHFYAFADQPELIHAINCDLLKFFLRALDRFCALCRPDFLVFTEDISYNKGTMISKSLFDGFIAPYYRQIIPRVKEYGIIPFVDSDGDIEEIIPWFNDVGIEGVLPLERQAGVDIVELRRKFPKLKIIGAYDKTVISKGEAAIRAEFERIFPVMRQGGYIPGVDHQTPPDVSLENYRVYLRLLNEYCRSAV